MPQAANGMEGLAAGGGYGFSDSNRLASFKDSLIGLHSLILYWYVPRGCFLDVRSHPASPPIELFVYTVHISVKPRSRGEAPV